MTQTDSPPEARRVWLGRVGSVWFVALAASQLERVLPVGALVLVVGASLVGVLILGRLPRRTRTNPLLDPGTNAGVTVAIMAIVVFVAGFIVLHEQLPEVERDTWMGALFGTGHLLVAVSLTSMSRPEVRA